MYGPRQDPHGEAGVVAIFCGRILAGRPLTVFGDGSQTRDYVHVSDVAAATYAAATKSLPEPKRLDDRAFNVGTGIATSVLELAEVLRKAAGSTTPIEFAPKRPGEQQQSFLTVEKAQIGSRMEPRRSRWKMGSPTRSAGSAPTPEPTETVTLALLQLQVSHGAVPSSPVDLILDATPVTQGVLILLVFLSLLSWSIMFGVWRSLTKAARSARQVLGGVRARVAARGRGRARQEVETQRAAAAVHARRSDSSPTRASPNQQVLERATTPSGGDTPTAATLSGSQIETLHLLLDTDASDERDRLGRFLPWLATIGSVSPLIGLLGTVLGVIEAFLGIASKGSGNLSAVAPGVGEALIATAAALAVAIPATFGYNIFAARLNRFDGQLERFSTSVIALLVREGRI